MEYVFAADQVESDGSATKISEIIVYGFLNKQGWSKVWVGPRHNLESSVFEPGTLSIKRFRSIGGAHPWIVRASDLKAIIPRFRNSCLLDFHFKSTDGDEVYSLNLKFSSGQIAFRAGNLYVSNVKDEQALMAEAKHLDDIFKF